MDFRLFYFGVRIWLNSTRSFQYKVAYKFENVFRFINDLIAINNDSEFWHKKIHGRYYTRIAAWENISPKKTTFLDLHFCKWWSISDHSSWNRLDIFTKYFKILTVLQLFGRYCIHQIRISPYQPKVAFHIETSHLFCSAKQMIDFYMKHNTRLKWVKFKVFLHS